MYHVSVILWVFTLGSIFAFDAKIGLPNHTCSEPLDEDRNLDLIQRFPTIIERVTQCEIWCGVHPHCAAISLRIDQDDTTSCIFCKSVDPQAITPSPRSSWLFREVNNPRKPYIGYRCAKFLHRDYRASENIEFTNERCKNWCLAHPACEAFSLWSSRTQRFCSLCASRAVEAEPPSPGSTWAFQAVADADRAPPCPAGTLLHTCQCGEAQCYPGSACHEGSCVGACPRGAVGATCTCGPELCLPGSICTDQCHKECSREKCSFHGKDEDPSDGCDECTCDVHWSGPLCENTIPGSIESLKVAFCHPVLFGDVDYHALNLFLDYYRRLGFDHFFLWGESNINVYGPDVTFQTYDPSTSEGFRSFPPDYHNGEATWYHGQNVAIDECLKMTKGAYDWVLFGDADEFLYLAAEPNLRSFLAEFTKFSYITLGKFMHSRTLRSDGEGLLQFLYRAEPPFCAESPEPRDLCPSYFGRRKYFIQPDRVSKLQIHEPTLFSGAGTDLSTAVANIREIRGFISGKVASTILRGARVQIEDHADLHPNGYGPPPLTLVRDDAFASWLRGLYGLDLQPAGNIAPGTEMLNQFKAYFSRNYENPCDNSIILVQAWEECGFGCALNSFVLGVLDSFFHQRSFVISVGHADYLRFFQNVFFDSAFPICTDVAALRSKPEQYAQNPHEFFLDHIQGPTQERKLRPLFHFIYSFIFSHIRPEIQIMLNETWTSLRFPPRANFTAMHVRRGDKCVLEAECLPVAGYFARAGPGPAFLMSDDIAAVSREADACCGGARVTAGADVVVEILIAARAKRIVCTGSSNVCRLLWGLSTAEVINLDTTSILCGDARNEVCIKRKSLAEYVGRQKMMERRRLQSNIRITTLPPTQSTVSPSKLPTFANTAKPSDGPTFLPTICPTGEPTTDPTKAPTPSPTHAPTCAPTCAPTQPPTSHPSCAPSTRHPTHAPSLAPTTKDPTLIPTNAPSNFPTHAPSFVPTLAPTSQPTGTPTFAPSFIPSQQPSLMPTLTPSFDPTAAPSSAPSSCPTASPTHCPSPLPSRKPTITTHEPSTFYPTNEPTRELVTTSMPSTLSPTQTYMTVALTFSGDYDMVISESVGLFLARCSLQLFPVECASLGADRITLTLRGTPWELQTAVAAISRDGLDVHGFTTLYVDLSLPTAAPNTLEPSTQLKLDSSAQGNDSASEDSWYLIISVLVAVVVLWLVVAYYLYKRTAKRKEKRRPELKSQSTMSADITPAGASPGSMPLESQRPDSPMSVGSIDRLEAELIHKRSPGSPGKHQNTLSGEKEGFPSLKVYTSTLIHFTAQYLIEESRMPYVNNGPPSVFLDSRGQIVEETMPALDYGNVV